MFKRLPAEVVARRGDRGKKGAAQEKAPAATAELEQVLQKRPDGRAKWLAKALIQASDGRLDAQSLYSVVAHNRFVEDLTEKAGNKMYRALHANLHVFSSKQRRYLEKECMLARKYAKTAFASVQKDAEGEDSKEEQAANAIEDMMARCRAFVRERQSERGERGEGGENGDNGAVPLQEPQNGESEVAPAGSVEAPPPAEPEPVAAAAVTGRASRSRSAPAPAKEKSEKSEKKATKAKNKKKKKREESSASRRRSRDSSSASRSRRKKHSKRSSRSSSSASRRREKKSGKRKAKESESTDRSKRKKKKRS